jgi:hypothetical protein
LGPDELNRSILLGVFTIPNSGAPVNPDLVLRLLNTSIAGSAFVPVNP